MWSVFLNPHIYSGPYMERHQNYRENNIIIYYIFVYSSLPSQIWILQHDNPFFPWGTNLIISQSFVFTADICCEDGASEMTAGSRGGKKTTTPLHPEQQTLWLESKLRLTPADTPELFT